MWDHPLEHGQPTRATPLKKMNSPSLRSHQPVSFSIGVGGGSLCFVTFLPSLSSSQALPVIPPFKFMASLFTNCYCMHICICTYICVHKYNMLSPHNVACMHVFQSCLVLHNQLMCPSWRRPLPLPALLSCL